MKCLGAEKAAAIQDHPTPCEELWKRVQRAGIRLVAVQVERHHLDRLIFLLQAIFHGIDDPRIPWQSECPLAMAAALRWKRAGMGRRGGVRVIYFVRYRPNEFWMQTLYAKAKQENVPAHILKQLKEAFEHE